MERVSAVLTEFTLPAVGFALQVLENVIYGYVDICNYYISRFILQRQSASLESRYRGRELKRLKHFRNHLIRVGRCSGN